MLLHLRYVGGRACLEASPRKLKSLKQFVINILTSADKGMATLFWACFITNKTIIIFHSVLSCTSACAVLKAERPSLILGGNQ